MKKRVFILLSIAILLSMIMTSGFNEVIFAKSSSNILSANVFLTKEPFLPEAQKNNKCFQMISTGLGFTVALRNDGTVWAWGRNSKGIIDNNTKEGYVLKPNQIKGLKDVKFVSAGYHHIAVVKNDGSVWVWGVYSNIGLGAPIEGGDLSIPTKIHGVSDVVAISSNDSFDIALKSDGTVWAWGINYTGQLGNGTIDNSMTPTMVIGLTDIVKVTAGADFALALKKDGTVWGWGNNSISSLGLGSKTTSSLVPKQLNSISNVVDISTYAASSAALCEDGTVWTWGFNLYGVMGGKIEKIRELPSKVNGIDNVKKVFAGSVNMFVVKKDGTLWGWGYNRNCELGDQKMLKSPLPIRIKGITNVVAVSGDASIFALRNDGMIWGWGLGPIGDGTIVKKKNPTRITYLDQLPQNDILNNEVSGSAKKAVLDMWNAGIMDSNLIGDFKTNIKRDEFVALLGFLYFGKANYNTQRKTPFEDIGDSQYNIYITQAQMLGIVGEKYSKSFNPFEEISRQEAAVIIYKTLKAIDNSGNYTVKIDKVFSDNKDISSEARPAVAYLYKKGIITGVSSNKFAPLKKITRLDSILWAYNTAKFTGRIKK